MEDFGSVGATGAEKPGVVELIARPNTHRKYSTWS